MTPRLAPVVQPKCNYCSKPRAEYRVHRLTTGQVICEYCLDWHFHALEFLGGAMPRGCQECGATWDELRAASPEVEIAVRMFVVPKDAVLQVLCAACVERYTPKRGDLYQGTRYGQKIQKLL